MHKQKNRKGKEPTNMSTMFLYEKNPTICDSVFFNTIKATLMITLVPRN